MDGGHGEKRHAGNNHKEPALLSQTGQNTLQRQWLLGNYRAEIHRFIASRVDADADVDDLTQQTLLQAIAKADSFRGVNWRAWLLTIARRLIIDFYRDRERVFLLSIDDEALQRAEPELRTSPRYVEMECLAHERIRCCLGCILTRLPAEEQVAVLLSDVHGFSNRESLTLLRMNLSAFKFLLRKARTRLNAAAAAEKWGNKCPLVTKTGVESACPGCADESNQARRNGGKRQRSGLDNTALMALRGELLNDLRVDNHGRL